jgi:hypothetical protein
LVLNNIILPKDNTHYFYHFHPNYKKTDTLDYEKYTERFLTNTDNNTDCLFFDFNNSARLSIPNKLDKVSVYTNNDIYIQNKFIEKILQKYKNKQETDELNTILLINAWNEWGENMVIEPGNINHSKYLLLIQSNLLSFFPYRV